MKKCIIFLAIVTITSCKITHNAPSGQSPNNFQTISTTLYVDQNGNFYPDNWKTEFGPQPRNASKYAYSLHTLNASKLNSYEVSWISRLIGHLKNKQRIFILIHGFNNDGASADLSFKKIRSVIKIDSTKDEFIEFHWDGLVSGTGIGSFKIWFNAAGYSQMAGEFGLRRILNLFYSKEIIIITHSRGASVALSALKNPPYEASFISDTKKFHSITIGNPDSLHEQGNVIKCIFLAPAIGLVDFRTPQYYTGDNSFRNFSTQLKSINITINQTDKTLKKYIGNLSNTLNPTNLGYNVMVFQQLKPYYPIMEYTEYTGLQSHDCLKYLESPKFLSMLNKCGIDTQ